MLQALGNDLLRLMSILNLGQKKKKKAHRSKLLMVQNSLPTSQAQVSERPVANEVITLFSLALHSRHNSIRRQLNLSNPDFNIQQLQKQEQLTGIGRIKPELYKQRSLDNDDGRRSNSKACGKLNFILKYDCDLEQLIVKIHKAVNLPAKDFSGTSDPYVKIYLLPDRKTKHQTKVHRKTLNPVFDEVFLFPVPYHDLAARKLHFSVYDFDRFSRHDLIGQVVVDHFLDLADFPRECILWKDIEYVTNVSPAFLHFGGLLGQRAHRILTLYFILGAKYKIHVSVHRAFVSEPPFWKQVFNNIPFAIFKNCL